MASSLPSFWWCSTCNFAENPWHMTACTMCGTVVLGKRPASPVPGAIAMARPNKLSRKASGARPDVVIAAEPSHPSSVVVEILGTEMFCQGHSCKEHVANCGEVLVEEVVVHLS